jgi:hypothetical protein
VSAAGVLGSAFCRIAGIHFQLVLVDMIAMHIVHVAVVQVTLVPIVQDGGVTTVISMLMRVPFMSFMIHELHPPLGAMPNSWTRSQEMCQKFFVEFRMDCFAGEAYSALYGTFRTKSA